ncbi:response regulator transcription factor [Neobacillus mesonae]|nr:response regulator transcription factor [Neobacillus mesonae]
MYKVLIVDDEPFIIEGLHYIVDWSSFGLSIAMQAENGADALRLLSDSPVDLLITDISMPVMDGLALIQEARKLNPKLKVIILSGFNEFDYLKQAMKLGIENYLLKPINVDELEMTLRNTVNKLNIEESSERYEALGIQILKDNTLYRWLNGQIAAREFEERVHLLEIPLNQPYIGVAVVRFDTNCGERIEEIYRIMGSDYTLFRDPDGDVVIIAALQDNQEDRNRFFDYLRDRAEDFGCMSMPVLIGVGRIGSNPEEAPESYYEAKKALEYFMIYSEEKIIHYPELGVSGDCDDREFPFDYEEYVKYLMGKETEKLVSKIKSDFEGVQHEEGVTPEGLKNAALEIVIRFKMELKAVRNMAASDIYKKGLRSVLNSMTFSELVSSLQQVARETSQLLQRDSRNPVINQIIGYIHDHYAEEMSLKMLAQIYHIHPVYLGQLFHKETGETFAEYINKFRVEKAKEQLKKTNLKVQEIARNVGYWETGYFYKQFRKYVGISPTDYKGLG